MELAGPVLSLSSSLFFSLSLNLLLSLSTSLSLSLTVSVFVCLSPSVSVLPVPFSPTVPTFTAYSAAHFWQHYHLSRHRRGPVGPGFAVSETCPQLLGRWVGGMGGDPLIALPNKMAVGCFSNQGRQVRCCLSALMSQGGTTLIFLIFPGTRITASPGYHRISSELSLPQAAFCEDSGWQCREEGQGSDTLRMTWVCGAMKRAFCLSVF